jgi:hypothetical protein
VFSFDEDCVAYSEVGLRKSFVIRGLLITFLSGSDVVLEVLVKVVQFYHELASPSGGEVSFRMHGEVWVVTFVGEKGEIPVVAEGALL